MKERARLYDPQETKGNLYKLSFIIYHKSSIIYLTVRGKGIKEIVVA